MTSYPPSGEWEADRTRPEHGPQDRTPGGHPYPVEGSDPSDRSMAILAHLSTLIAMIVSAGWLSFVGPLVMWFVFKDKKPFVQQAAAGAFNFNIGVWVAGIVGWILTITVVGAIIGIPILIIVAIITIVFPILGAIRANRGERYDYPFKITVLN